MGRKVCSGSGVVGLLDFQVLEDLFTKYESYGRLRMKCEHSVGLNLFKFQRMWRDVGLFTDSPGEAKLLFESAVQEGERMTFDEYLRIVVDIAERFFPHTPCNETALHHFITEYLSCRRIGTDSEKLSSTSSFTTQGSCGPHVLPWDKLEEYSLSKRSLEDTDVGRKLAVNFVETSLTALQKIYNVYAKHWCCAGHEKSPRTRWKWRSSVCYGGFRKFLKESCLIERAGSESCCDDGTSSVETNEALDNEFSEQAIKTVFYKLVDRNNGLTTLSFWQFVTGISAVVGDEAEHEGKSSIMVIEKMLENCVQIADTLAEEETGSIPVHGDLITGDVSSLLHRNDHFLKPIFAQYASTLVAKLKDSGRLSVLSSCTGGGGFVPVISVKGLRGLCSEFELIPRFTTVRRIQDFVSSSQVSEENDNVSEAHVTYEEFLVFLITCSETGLSKYPLRPEETTKLEKVHILLERMLYSRGVATVFDKCQVKIDKGDQKKPETSQAQAVKRRDSRYNQQEDDKDQTSNCIFVDATSSIPDDMTPLKAVNALDCFEALKARYNLDESVKQVQAEPLKAKPRQTDTIERRQKVGKSKLYRLSHRYGKDPSYRKMNSGPPIWTGRPRTKPRKPRPRAGGRLVFNPAFRKLHKEGKPNRGKKPIGNNSSVSSDEQWCDSQTRTIPGGFAESVASCESWWDTRSALSIEERIELALQRT